MSKHNGNRLPPKSKNDNGVEKYHYEDPEGVLIGDGISIVAAGEDGEGPSEVHLYCKVPGVKYASRFMFREPEFLTDFIEELIAYRRLVFPDAREIDTNAGEDTDKKKEPNV